LERARLTWLGQFRQENGAATETKRDKVGVAKCEGKVAIADRVNKIVGSKKFQLLERSEEQIINWDRSITFEQSRSSSIRVLIVDRAKMNEDFSVQGQSTLTQKFLRGEAFNLVGRLV